MLELARLLALPLLSLILLIMGSGLINTLSSLLLETYGSSPETIGAVTSSFYIGILIGSICLGKCIAKLGHIRSFVLFALVSMFLVLVQAIWIDPWYWGVLRSIFGFCTAGIFIVIESWLLMQSPASSRSVVLSLYLAVFYAALSGGQFLIHVTKIDSMHPFYITASLFFLSTLPMAKAKVLEPKIEHEVSFKVAELFRLSPLGFLGGIISGMLLAAIYGLVPIYAKESGMSVSEIGTLMGIIILGGLSFQWPMGRLADKTNRRKVLTLASLAAALVAILIAYVAPSSWFLLFLGWCFGGFSFTIYPLSMAYACEKVENHQIVAVTGSFVLSYGIGAILGPLIAPVAMSILGAKGLFYFLASITLLFCFAGIKGATTRAE